MDDPRRVLQRDLRAQGEEQGTSPDLMMVRAVLQNLPKADCPTGFEYRLQRRLEGTEVSPSRSANRNWSMGWAGVSLGFAAAVVIGVFAFDLNFSSMGSKPGVVAGSAATPAPVTTEPPVQVVTTPAEQGTEQMATDDTKPVHKDSLPKATPYQVPEDIIRVTGTQP